MLRTYYLQKHLHGVYILVDGIVLSKFFEGYLKVLLIPEVSASHQPRYRVRIQIIILSLRTSNLHALEERKRRKRMLGYLVITIISPFLQLCTQIFVQA